MGHNGAEYDRESVKVIQLVEETVSPRLSSARTLTLRSDWLDADRAKSFWSKGEAQLDSLSHELTHTNTQHTYTCTNWTLFLTVNWLCRVIKLHFTETQTSLLGLPRYFSHHRSCSSNCFCFISLIHSKAEINEMLLNLKASHSLMESTFHRLIWQTFRLIFRFKQILHSGLALSVNIMELCLLLPQQNLGEYL